MQEISSEVRDLLDQHPWEDTIPLLVDYGVNKARRLFWQGILNGHLPEGAEVSDAVSCAVMKVISGERRWDPTSQPDLFDYLRSVVDSEISHLVTNHANRFIRSEASLPMTHADGQEVGFFETKGDAAPNPEAELLLREQELLSEDFTLGFCEFVKDVPLLPKVLDCILDGVDKPADIAARLGEKVKDIYNAKKTMRRRLAEYQQARTAGKKAYGSA